MFTFKVYTVGNILGWASPMSTLKEHLSGAMGHRLTSIIGRQTNQTTFTMKTVFIHLVSSRVISTNGTMSIARNATDLPARGVRALILIDLIESNFRKTHLELGFEVVKLDEDLSIQQLI